MVMVHVTDLHFGKQAVFLRVEKFDFPFSLNTDSNSFSVRADPASFADDLDWMDVVVCGEDWPRALAMGCVSTDNILVLP